MERDMYINGFHFLVEFYFKFIIFMRCKYCKLSKSSLEFFTKFMCIICRINRKKEAQIKFLKNNKMEIQDYNKNYYDNNKFNILNSKKKYRQFNREELRLYAKTYAKNYRKNNKDKVLQSIKKYNIKNKLKKKEYDKKYWKINKVKKLKECKERNRQRYRLEPVFRIKHVISVSINKELKKNNLSKNNSSILKYLPYSIQQLKIHLESLFEPWMTWQNHGTYRTESWKNEDQTTWTWNIDHIVPHSKFHYVSMTDPSFHECWALTNLRPYSSKQNIMDSDRE